MCLRPPPQVKHPGRTLVFVNAVSATRRLAALLGRLGIPAVALHASQQQRQRLKARITAFPSPLYAELDIETCWSGSRQPCGATTGLSMLMANTHCQT